MSGDLISEQRFYDHRWATSQIGEKELERASTTVSAIPSDCASILDVGCGDGLVAFEAQRRTGAKLALLDFSFVALGRIQGQRFCASAHQLPFADQSFDLVMTTEILEHIPESLYPVVLRELARVSRRYVLITVPNQENLTENLARCDKCGARFHLWGHVRRYSPQLLRDMMPGYNAARIQPFGNTYVTYHPWLLSVKQNLGGAWVWEENRTSCLTCGNTVAPRTSHPFVGRVCDALNYRVWKYFGRQESWILALYQRS